MSKFWKIARWYTHLTPYKHLWLAVFLYIIIFSVNYILNSIYLQKFISFDEFAGTYDFQYIDGGFFYWMVAAPIYLLGFISILIMVVGWLRFKTKGKIDFDDKS